MTNPRSARYALDRAAARAAVVPTLTTLLRHLYVISPHGGGLSLVVEHLAVKGRDLAHCAMNLTVDDSIGAAIDAGHDPARLLALERQILEILRRVGSRHRVALIIRCHPIKSTRKSARDQG